MKHNHSTLAFMRCLFALLLLAVSPFCAAWELSGVKSISALTHDHQLIPIGSVEFTPHPDGTTTFKLSMNYARFTDHFLSMKEFKCLESPEEVVCHVPYPYKNPAIVSDKNYDWLEHSLLFLFKQPRDFGAKMWNGLYYRFERDSDGLVGIPQAVDLNLISAPPDNLLIPPYNATLRGEITPGTRWIDRLLIR